jgi:hypothetical protein
VLGYHIRIVSAGWLFVPVVFNPFFVRVLAYVMVLLEAPAEGFFRNLVEFGRHIRFDVLHCCETCPLETHFRVGNSQKSLGTRSGECGGWVMTQQVMCGSVQKPLSLPATCGATSSAQLAQQHSVQAYGLMVHQTVYVK